MTTETEPRTPKATIDSSRQRAALGQLADAEAEALRNDLQEAQALAAEYQRKLASKSNDLAVFKQTLERALGDLSKLQGTVTELRAERHRLAAEVMRLEWVKEKVVTLSKRVLELEREKPLKRVPATVPNGGMINVSYECPGPDVMVFASEPARRRVSC